MKFILNIVLILLIVSTFCICAIKPDMHKTVFVYDSAYTIVPEAKVTTEEKVIPIMEKTLAPKTTVKTVETPIKTETKTIKKQEVKTTKQTQTTQKQQVKQPQKTTVSSTTVQTQTTVKKPETKKIEIKTELKTEPVIKKEKTVKTLTQKEEEIAWNTWRSNLQNKIMQDVKLPIIPNGIIFKFSFTVDMFGKVSNVQTWSTTPAYTPYAIQYIAPVIRNYQGKSILNFPNGTARTVTNVTGGWKISDNERLSTPQDYNDIEKIRK